jgi:hypothetical protein
MSAVLWKATLSGHLISAGLSPSTSLEPPVIKQFMLALVLAPIHLLAPAADSWPECRHDPTVTERFLPVELINGEPLPATDVLQLVAIDKGGLKSEVQHLTRRKVLRWKNNERRTSNSGLKSEW